MRVAKYYSNHDVRVEEQSVPEIGPGEVLARIEASGICGSDVMEWYRAGRGPLVLGHEVAGVIVETGDGVSVFKAGHRVAVSHHVPCNTCRYCLNGHHTVCDTLRETHFDPGGFAEYVRVPAINVDRGLFLLPDSMSFEEGSMLEPLGCVVRGQRLASVKPGQCVLVMGSGLTGLLHIQTARALGAGPIVAVDIVDFRLQEARRLGADATILATDDMPARLREITGGRLADLVVLSTGAIPAIESALKSVERDGTVLFFAPSNPGGMLQIPLNDIFWRNEIKLLSTYACSPQDFMAARDLVHMGRVRVSDMISHRLGLAETGLGFRLTAEAQDSLKVIVEPQR